VHGIRPAIAVAALGTAAAFFTVSPASAMPRYSARYEQRCALCHVNPSGGGLRAPYATQQLVPEEIAWSPDRPAILEALDPKIGKHLLIGADFRELYVRSDVAGGDLNFFQMQADLYLGFQLDSRVTLYYDLGQSGNYELFGLGYLYPTFYLKAGRFIPSYGWKVDDHTMYVRSELGLAPPANSDVGLEAGFSRGRFDAQVALVNGNRGSTLDTDSSIAKVANLVYRCHAGPVGAAFGASGYHNPTPSGTLDTAGLYGYFTLQRLTWLWETDFVRRRDAGGTTKEGLAASHELTWLVRQGLELLATFDSYDPDRRQATGAKSRIGAGIFAMPRPYATLELLVRRTRYDDGVAYSGDDFTETVMQIHLLY